MNFWFNCVVITGWCFALLSAESRTPIKFDEFGRIPCAEEKARVDNYGRALREQSTGLAAVLIYAGRNDARKGEVISRLFGIRDRLASASSINPNRIVILDGGFRDKLEVQLWILPAESREAALMLRDSEVASNDIPLKSPRIEKWEYKCRTAR